MPLSLSYGATAERMLDSLKQAGLEPSYVLKLSEYADYDGQKIVVFRGKRWRVLRTYVTEHAIELTIGEAVHDA